MRLSALLPTFAALLLGSATVHAQISITSETLYPYPPGETVAFDNFSTSGGNVPADDQARIDALIAQTGANQTWDFTTITYPEQVGTEVTLFTDLASVPGSDRFPSATVAVGNAFAGAPPGAGSTSYTYSIQTDAALTGVGFYIPASAGAPEYVETFDGEGLVRFEFPFTAGSDLSDETLVTPSMGQMYRLGESRTVLGYGTLTTPEGSAPCVMFREGITRSSPDGTVITTLTRYMWQTLTGLSAMASNEELAPGVRNYTAFHGIQRSGVAAEPGALSPTLAVAVGPNPVRGATTVRLTATAPLTATVTVSDALGREVARLHDGPLSAGSHALPVDTSDLAPGVYVVRAEAGRDTVTSRIAVVR